jgi:23S rRNA (uracil1939-C5)-methyltransferase
VEVKNYQDILGSDPIYQYRNKLEFTFSNKAWEANFDKNNPGRIPALGFHIPGMFDKVLDLEHCQLAPEAANTIRQTIKAKAIEMGLEFFDIRQQTGFLRNLMLRSNHKGEWLLVLVVAQHKTQLIEALFDAVMPELNMVSEWCYVINTKANDTWSDLPVETYKGQGHLIEQLEDLTFTIRPQSFFQTNTKQALALYQITRDFANIQQHETVYDLYTGTGTIALFVAKQAKQVIGIEYVEAAIIDAKNNAQLNQIDNTHFYAGDMKLVLNDDLIQKHGKADVVITDPPRDGMHPSVVQKIIELGPNRIVYVSCNTSTQARDIALLSEHYEVDCLKTVDMFPHTHHVESVALLIKKA